MSYLFCEDANLSYSSCISLSSTASEIVDFSACFEFFMKFITYVFLLMVWCIDLSRALQWAHPDLSQGCWAAGGEEMLMGQGAGVWQSTSPVQGQEGPSILQPRGTPSLSLLLIELPSWNTCAHTYHWMLFPKAVLWYNTTPSTLQKCTRAALTNVLHLPRGSFLFHQSSSSLLRIMLAFGVSLSTWFQWRKIKGK